MFSKIRSLIFKLEPELAHTLAIKALKFNYNPINNIPKDSSIKTMIFGKKIFNPIGIAAGFDKDAEVYNSLFRLGFGFVEVGTITPLKQYGNPKPRVFRLEEDEALINRLGFNNSGVEKIALEALIRVLESCNDQMQPEEIQTKIYSAGKENGYSENLRDWFKLIYEVVFGDENGPRMGFFISFFGVNETKQLIKNKIE